MGDEIFVSNWVGVESVPESYVFPPEMRPTVAVKRSVPIIDFGTLDRASLVREVHDVSQEFGFFQMINHGVPKMLLEETMKIFRGFHGMSIPDKLRECSRDPNKSCKIYTSGKADGYMTEETHLWRDCIIFNCHPLDKYVHFWPQNPPKFREVVEEYCKAMRKLTMKLIELICEGLGMGRECLEKEMTENTMVVANHYPPCPNPNLAMGLSQHCDPTLITILFQDISGLQFLKDGEWVSVDPIDGALLVNIGYVLQVISNGQLKARLHRAITNSELPRQSLAYLVNPEDDATIKPANCLKSEVDRPQYRSLKYGNLKRDQLSMNGDHEAMLQYLSCNYQP